MSILDETAERYWNGDGFMSAVEVYLTAAGTAAWSLPLSANVLEDAHRYTVRCRAVDRNGNVQVAPSISSFRFDTVAPATTLNVEGTRNPDGSFAGPVTGAFTASDATSGVATLTYSLDGGETWLAGDSFRLTVDGVYEVRYYSTDQAGNREQTKSLTITVDQLSPVLDAVNAKLQAEDARDVIVPRLFLSQPFHNGSTDFLIDIRYSSPSDSAYLSLDGEPGITIEHLGGTLDRALRLTKPNAQRAGQYSVILYDKEGGTPLERAYVYWDSYRRWGSVTTEQPAAWDPAENIRTVRSTDVQLTPGLAVDIEGRMLFVSYQTPHDQAVVQITRRLPNNALNLESFSAAAYEHMTHPGGTQSRMVQIAIGSDIPAGTMDLQLLDRHFGHVLATLPIHWDGTVITLRGEPSMAATDVQERALLTTVDGLRPDIASLQATAMYEKSAFFITGLQWQEGEDPGRNFAMLLIKAFPNLFFLDAADEAKEIDRRWQADPTYSRGWHQDQFIKEQRWTRDTYWNHLNGYNDAASNLIMQSIRYWVDLKTGAPESKAHDTLFNAWNVWNIGAMANLGVRKPGFEALRLEGRRLYGHEYKYLLQVQDDNAKALIADAYQARLKEQRDEVIGLQARILEKIFRTVSATNGFLSSLLTKWNDPQLAYHWAQRIVSEQGEALTLEETKQYVAAQLGDISAVVKNEAAVTAGGTETGGGTTLDDEYLTETVGKKDSALFERIRRRLAGKTNAELYTTAINWYDSNDATATDLSLVRQDTVLGKMYLGLYQQLRQSQDDADIAVLAITMDRLTDIPASKMYWKAKRSHDAEQLRRNLQSLFKDAEYNALFTLQDAAEPTITTCAVDLPLYTHGDIRIRFDVANHGREIAYVTVHLESEHGLPVHEIRQSKSIAGARDALYVKVPVAAITTTQCLPSVRLLLTVHFTDESYSDESREAVEAFTEPFGVSPRGATPGTIGPQEILGEAQWDRLTDSQRSLLRDALTFGDLSGDSGNAKILRYLINNYLSRSGSDPLQYESSIEFRGQVHGTGLMQCKQWLGDVVVRNATGRNLPLNDKATTGAWVSTEFQIGQLSTEENFQQLLSRSDARAGDIIQMYFELGNSAYQHTMVIGSITEEGVWVFDTNFGSIDEEWASIADTPAGQIPASAEWGVLNPENGKPRAMTNAEVAAGDKPQFWRHEDNTVRYHYMGFDGTLNPGVRAATLHRIP